MTGTDSKVWFPAKRYGWGWGLPSTWQGWIVLALYLGFTITSALVFNKPVSLIVIAALTVVLIVICWLKGEKPRWLWGNDD
jgi:hypothetical protein